MVTYGILGCIMYVNGLHDSYVIATHGATLREGRTLYANAALEDVRKSVLQLLMSALNILIHHKAKHPFGSLLRRTYA